MSIQFTPNFKLDPRFAFICNQGLLTCKVSSGAKDVQQLCRPISFLLSQCFFSCFVCILDNIQFSFRKSATLFFQSMVSEFSSLQLPLEQEFTSQGNQESGNELDWHQFTDGQNDPMKVVPSAFLQRLGKQHSLFVLLNKQNKSLALLVVH